MNPQPQMHRARRVARLVRAIPAAAGANIGLKRVIGGETLPDLDPFLSFDELSARSLHAISGGFPDQTLRGFESITYMTRGRLRYSDNAGRSGVIEPGGVQWLTSGRGCLHSEMPELTDGEIQGFQLWLNLPAAEKMQASQFHAFAPVDIPAVIFRTAEVRVISGRYHGLLGPVTPQTTRPFIADIILRHEGEITLPVNEDQTAFVYVYQGGVAIGRTLVNHGQAAILDSGNVLNLVAGQGGARLLALTAQPINEPIVRHGPFVMTTHAEIKQAFSDYQNGLF